MARASARLTAVITGKAREVGPAASHERNVLAITGRIHKKAAQLREALATVARLRKELRHDRRELRAVLQRSSTVTEAQLEIAGAADAVDALNARLERADRPRCTKIETSGDAYRRCTLDAGHSDEQCVFNGSWSIRVDQDDVFGGAGR